MASPPHACCPAQAGRGQHQIPVHFGSLESLLEAVREHSDIDGAIPVLCAARYLELPAHQWPGGTQSVWGVLVTARLLGAAGRSEATLSAWLVAEELPRHVATVPQREAARARLTDLHCRVRQSIQADGFPCRIGQHPVPVTAFLCPARCCPAHRSPATSGPLQPADVPDACHGVSEPADAD